jgi:glycerol-3-phosphate dehydrogenase
VDSETDEIVMVGTTEMDGTGSRLKTQVLIIGGGIAGVGLARDLALRGVQCLVVEKKHVNSGASGANHGLLHSGARYVSNDPVTAQECGSESRLLRQLAPGCCEDTGGLFVAVAGDDESYIADFPQLCERNGIPMQQIDCKEARDLEPELSENIIAAFRVEDATLNPFRLSYDNMADAIAHGARLLTYTQVVGMERRGRRVSSVKIRELRTGREIEVEADQVVNASGAWAGKVAELVGLRLPVVWSKGSILITQRKITDRVINRLRPAADGDIVVPEGTVSLVGTTSVRVDDIENVHADFAEVDFLVKETAKMVPIMHDTRLIRAFAGVRPLLGSVGASDDRAISRGLEIIDHEKDGLVNLATVLSGKLTTFRHTAEKAADLICRRLGVSAPCLTRELPLPNAPANNWVVAGLAPGLWRQLKKPKDALLCECEMVPVSAIGEIVDQLKTDAQPFDLDAIRLRSRMGKGSCQGAFCGLRTTNFLYDLDMFKGDEGVRDFKGFLETRWKGLRPVLWGPQLVQEQLQEAIHCGLFNLETRMDRDL